MVERQTGVCSCIRFVDPRCRLYIQNASEATNKKGNDLRRQLCAKNGAASGGATKQKGSHFFLQIFSNRSMCLFKIRDRLPVTNERYSKSRSTQQRICCTWTSCVRTYQEASSNISTYTVRRSRHRHCKLTCEICLCVTGFTGTTDADPFRAQRTDTISSCY